MAALCSTGLAASSWRFLRGILGDEGEAMRLVTYGAVAAIALGSVLLGLDWLSAPMSPMADTEAGLRAAAPPRVAAPPATPQPVAATSPSAPTAPIGAPIVSPNLAAPRNVNTPASSGATAQAAATSEPADAPLPAVRCNVNACATAYPHSFRATDCTYQPSNGPRRLCAK
jgi:BA14K-like protein